MKSKTILWIIGIILLIIILYWLYTKNKLTFIGISKVVSDPGEETNCNRDDVRDEGCPPPMTEPLYLVKSDVKERAWTEESLGFNPNPGNNATRETPITIRIIGKPETWTYNQTRFGNNKNSPSFNPNFPITKDKFYFIDNPKYPNPAVA